MGRLTMTISDDYSGRTVYHEDYRAHPSGPAALFVSDERSGRHPQDGPWGGLLVRLISTHSQQSF